MPRFATPHTSAVLPVIADALRAARRSRLRAWPSNQPETSAASLRPGPCAWTTSTPVDWERRSWRWTASSPTDPGPEV